MLLDGKEIYEVEKEKLIKEDNSKLSAVFVQVGNNSASNFYVARKMELCTDVGILAHHLHYDEDITEEELLKRIDLLNRDESVTGFMVQLPLPKHIDESKIINAISPEKDIDGFTHMQKGRLMEGVDCILPCTPKGIMTMLKHYCLDDLEGKKVVIVGRSNIVGKPLAMMMINAGATVTVCNSKTDKYDLAHLIMGCDIFISAIGQANYFDKEFFATHGYEAVIDYGDVGICPVAIDVGINRDSKGKLCGDIDRELYDYFDFVTPVPGGVGKTTVLEVVKNIRECYNIQSK